MKFETTEAKKKSYIIKIVGSSEFPASGRVQWEKTTLAEESDITEFELTLLSYLSKGLYTTVFNSRKWTADNESHYGKDYKHCVLTEYMNCLSCIDLQWDDINSISLYYIDADSKISIVNFPDIDKEFESEESFVKYVDVLYQERLKTIERTETEEFIYLDSYDCKLAREIALKAGFNKEDVSNLFCIDGNTYLRFPTDFDADFLNKLYIANIPTDGKTAYTGLKEETFNKLSAAISSTDLSNEAKLFAIDILKKYEWHKPFEQWEINYIKNCVQEVEQHKFTCPMFGPDGFSGIIVMVLKDPDKYELEGDEIVVEHNGKTYLIVEAD